MFRSLLLAVLFLPPVHLPGQDDPERILQRAIASHQSGNVEAAIRDYRAYLKLRPDAAQARSNLGAALASTGRYTEAIAEYQAVLRRGPRDARVWLNLALAYYKSGDISKAATELSALHAAEPANHRYCCCWPIVGFARARTPRSSVCSHLCLIGIRATLPWRTCLVPRCFAANRWNAANS